MSSLTATDRISASLNCLVIVQYLMAYNVQCVDLQLLMAQ